MKKFLVITLVMCLGSQLPLAKLFADNWPQWRGSKLNSVSLERDLPSSFSPENQLWRFELPGPGGASPIVWNDNIFVATVDGNELALLCISTAGEMKWKQKLDGKNKSINVDRSNSASPSPVTDGNHVWVMLTDGIMHCFTVDGELVWKKDLQKEYGRFLIQFGMTSTPLLDSGNLYLQFIHGSMRSATPSKGKLVALNAATGDEEWVHVRNTPARSENKHAYTSPTIFRNSNKEFLIVHGADYTTGHRLDNGSELWRVGGFNPAASYNNFLRFVASPVCTESLIVIPSAKNGPVIGLSPDATGTILDEDKRIKWKLMRGTPDVATPVISGNRVYLAQEKGVLICLDAQSGEKHYEERLMRDKHRSTPVAADGRIYLVGRDGTAFVIADDSEFKLISQTPLNEDTTASPAISNGKIYVRTNKSLMAFGNK